MPLPCHRGRFAPSPTGPLHLGSLLAAFGSWLLARHARGEWLIRIEDIDSIREVAGAAQQQLHTLAACGMHSDSTVQWQSQRSEYYASAVNQLLSADAAFECRCSRGDLAVFDGIHRRCLGGRSLHPAIRLRVPDIDLDFADAIRGHVSQALGEKIGDFVLKRADGCWAYQLAVVVDDAAQGITHVVRGADLLDSTPRQIYLQRTLGLPTPHYAHLPLLLDPEGHKLSKSLASAPVDPNDPKPALRLVWQALGQVDHALDGPGDIAHWLERAVDNFQPERIPRCNLIVPAQQD